MGDVVSSPLRYPGGKYSYFNKLLEYIPDDTDAIVSPFFGGGAIELNLAYRGVWVYGYDICPYLLNFWQYWLKSPASIERHAKTLISTYTREALKAVKRNRQFTGFEGATLYYLCNRLAYGGMTLNHTHLKQYEAIEGQFVYPLYTNQTCRRRLFPHTAFWKALPRLPLTVEKADFKESLSRHPNLLAILDPPYVGLEYFYNLSGFDHIGLSQNLIPRENWILFYNDHPLVCDLYEGYPRIALKTRNFNTGKKTNTDFIIFSHDIAERLEYQLQLKL